MLKEACSSFEGNEVWCETWLRPPICERSSLLRFLESYLALGGYDLESMGKAKDELELNGQAAAVPMWVWKL